MSNSLRRGTLNLEHAYNRALRHFKNAEYQLASDICLEILHRLPQHSDSNHLLGLGLMQLGDVLNAMPFFNVSLKNDPRSVRYQQSYLEALFKLFGGQHYAQLVIAAKFFTERIPSSGQGWHMLGVGYAHQHQHEEAKSALWQAQRLLPDNPYVMCSLGNTFSDLGRVDDAIAEYQKAVQIKTDFAMAYNNLGNAFTKTVHKDEALANFQRAIQLKPSYAEAFTNMGVLYRQMGKFDDAIDAYRQALALDPESTTTCSNLAGALRSVGRIRDALACSEHALRNQPDRPEFWTTYADVLVDAFRLDEAIECYIKALSFKTDDVDDFNKNVFSSLLFYLNYHPDFPAEAIYGAYCDYERRFCAPLLAVREDFPNVKDVNRKHKVGYVSSAFASHPCKHFLIPLLEHHQHQDFEIYAFAELDKSDEYTEQYQQMVDHWIVTSGMSDDQIAERIRAEQIDILVDISGHSGNHRLAVFARKPAPVSLHWLDFGYTTGLKAIDYYLTDQHNVPPGQDHLFSEQPWRLPRAAFVFRPNAGMGEVGPLPASGSGNITFGTLTRAIRINHRTIRVWSEILKRVPGSKLVINSGSFRTAEVQDAMLARFLTQGIAADRLEIGFQSPPWDVLRQIDIGFDCFPHNSGTTLFETLLMGVPFITLAGRASVGRLGSSILHGLGHPEWVAYSEDEYIDKAVALASDITLLARLRSNLRAEMQVSALMDEKGFALEVENAYRQMWQTYCKDEL